MAGVLAGAIAVATSAGRALADPAADADQCIVAAERSQPLRHDGKLRAARSSLLRCSRVECPLVVRTDCTKWLLDLDTLMPSIVLAAVDEAGADIADVRVSIDGEPLTTSLDGKEIDVDPGRHTLRFEHAGSAPIQQQLVFREAERHRAIRVTFAGGGALSTASATPGHTASARRQENGEPPGRRGRSLVLPIAVLGAGAAGFAVASYFWASGLADRATLASGCAVTHSCTDSAIASARGKLIAGDVAGGLGLAAAAVGTGIFVFGRSEQPSVGTAADGSTGALVVGARPDGAMLEVQGSF
jgi:hypothetical protein